MANGEQIRQAVEQVAGRGRRRRYGSELRVQILAYAVDRKAHGADLETIGAELDVPWRTIARWCAVSRKQGRSFRRVEVVAKTSPGFTVHGPRGVRIDGMDLDAVAELIRRLG
jgi:hypothetical protein